MTQYTATLKETNDDIAQLVAQSHRLSKNLIFPYVDNREFLTELFVNYDCEDISIISVGTSTPDIAIAADKANMSFKEIVSNNPFTNSLDNILEEIKNGDIVYLANPNKITGANFSLSGLKKIIDKNKDGLVIIDEYYFDFYGITGLPLITEYDNLIILRSFMSVFGIYSSDSGYAVSSKKIIAQCKDTFLQRQFSTILRKTILATMANPEAVTNRLHEIREESLRLTKRLTQLGLQCRITATDFLLMRVASPKDVGNYLTSSRIEIDNLDGYPKMKHYIRFRIESHFSNDKLIKAFENMPVNYYKMNSIEKKPITLHRPSGETVTQASQVDSIVPRKIKNRTKTSEIAKTIHKKHLFTIVE